MTPPTSTAIAELLALHAAMTNGLRACPFCGGTDLYHRQQCYSVVCRRCGNSGPPKLDKEAAITAWNTRADATIVNMLPSLLAGVAKLAASTQRLLDTRGAECRAMEVFEGSRDTDDDELWEKVGREMEEAVVDRVAAENEATATLAQIHAALRLPDEEGR